MVKLVDTLLLGSSARASRFKSEWRYFSRKISSITSSYVRISIQSISIVMDQSYLSIIDLIRE
uniref:ORF62f n=1 Tax=Pinus koraiensis TaxID=88728 RepID=A4QME3_PINKO|nr:ORF62f [Pinus koraiensis]ABP35480.1 ORF62f [Pinus koraiensis]